MAKSRSESSLFPLLRHVLSEVKDKRGKGSYEAISLDSPRGRKECLARAKAVLNVVRGFSLVQNKEHDPEGSHYRPRKKGGLIMRQALNLGLLKKNVSNDSSLEESTPGESEDKLDTYKGGNND